MIVRVVDIETTGMEPPEAEVIELGLQDVACQPDGTEARMIGEVRSWLRRPERPCPPEVMAVHHILPEQLELQPRFVCAGWVDETTRVTGRHPGYLAAHNAEFEQSFLSRTAQPTSQPWICTYKAALRVWPEAPSHGNQALMYWLGLHQELKEGQRHPPHRAGPDAYVTAAILCRLLQVATIEQMVEWTREPRVLPTCPIGEWRGRRWSEVDAGFLTWMIRKPVEPDLVWNARRELERRRTEHMAGRS